MKYRQLIILLLCLHPIGCLAQAGYYHFEVQGGYELFPDMSNKSGFDFHIGGRYAFSQTWFAATMLHGGINNGTYEGMYAGKPTELDHTLREYMVGIGPGIYLFNGGNRWIYADLLVGYGFGEELKTAEESCSRSLSGFAAASHLGAEYQLRNGWICGLSIGGYYTGRQIRPAINLKWGFNFSL